MSVDQAYNFKAVNELLSTAGLLSEEQLAQLKAEGYEAVINLLPDESEYAIANEAAIVNAQGIIYDYIPVDFSAPTENDYALFAEKFSALDGKKVMLHCAANYRVSAFYSIYACQQGSWSQTQAREFMGALWNPGDYPVWDAFIAKLLGENNE